MASGSRLVAVAPSSKAEDPLNLIIGLSKPEGYEQDQGAWFDVSFEKSRGAHGEAVAPFSARLTASGWQSETRQGTTVGSVESRLLTYVRIASEAGEAPKSASAAISGAGVNRGAGFKAWPELLASGKLIPKNGRFYAR